LVVRFTASPENAVCGRRNRGVVAGEARIRYRSVAANLVEKRNRYVQRGSLVPRPGRPTTPTLLHVSMQTRLYHHPFQGAVHFGPLGPTPARG